MGGYMPPVSFPNRRDMDTDTRADFEPDVDFAALEGVAEQVGAYNQQGNEQFSEQISQDVEGLLYLGYLTTDVQVYGHHFTLKTLTRGERLAVAQVTKEYQDTLSLS